MKSKSVAYLLIIGSLLGIVLDLNEFFYFATQSNSDYLLQMIFNLLIKNAASVGFAWIGFSLLRQGKLPDKKIGIIFAILTLLDFGVSVYYSVSYFSSLMFRENILNAVFNYMAMIIPVCVVLFWLMFLAGKISKGAAWLLAGGIFSCIYWFSGKAVLVAISLSSRNPFGSAWGNFTIMASILDILYSLALVAFAFFILKRYEPEKNVESTQYFTGHEDLLDGVGENPLVSEAAMQKEEKIPSVFDWFSDFLLVLIPLFGLGFLVWRGQNNADRYRRNWAIATLFWSAVGFALLSLVYLPILGRFGRNGGITAILVLVIFTLFCIAIGLAGKARRDDEDAEGEYVPSVLAWFGRGFAISIPLVGLIVLITSAVDDEDMVRKKWAIAHLLRMAVVLVYYFSIYVSYSGLERYIIRGY